MKVRVLLQPRKYFYILQQGYRYLYKKNLIDLIIVKSNSKNNQQSTVSIKTHSYLDFNDR